MTDELLTLDDIALLFRCTRRRARDVLVKSIGFPPVAPGSTRTNPLWVKIEVRAFIQRKPARIPRESPAKVSAAMV